MGTDKVGQKRRACCTTRTIDFPIPGGTKKAKTADEDARDGRPEPRPTPRRRPPFLRRCSFRLSAQRHPDQDERAEHGRRGRGYGDTTSSTSEFVNHCLRGGGESDALRRVHVPGVEPSQILPERRACALCKCEKPWNFAPAFAEPADRRADSWRTASKNGPPPRPSASVSSSLSIKWG